MTARGGAPRPAWLFWLFAVAVSGCSSARGPSAPKSPVRPAADPKSAPAVVTPAPASPDAPFEFPGSGPIRVGLLASTARASISAPSGVLIATPGSSRATPLQRATFVAGAARGGPRWEVQVGSVTSEEAAKQLARRAESVVTPARVRWNAASSTYRVRVGSFTSREVALEAARSLEAKGLPGWVVEGESDRPAAASLRLLETREPIATARIRPARRGELLTVDGERYRGTLEVLSWRDGLNVVNIVPLEEYLRGVVPKELSPDQFGELEALKAQAVAARTYAIRNRGRYRERGYDICATPACQVYGGREAEHALSDRAVQETIGLVAFYEGRPINALYTSTCGGSTEDGVNLFPADPAPYLKGVACAWETSGWGVVSSSREEGLTARGPALLAALGVLSADVSLESEATSGELVGWSDAMLGALGLRGCTAEAPTTFHRASFFRYLVARLCWSERAERMVSPQDHRYLLPSGDRSGWSDQAERLAATWLVQEGLLRPGAGDTLAPRSPVLRADAVSLLAGIVDRLSPKSIEAASFVALRDGVLRLQPDRDRDDAVDRVPEFEVPLAAGVRLFRTTGLESLAARELRLTPGEQLRLIRNERGEVGYLEALQSPLGPSTDRDSRYHRWVVSRTPEELAASLKRYGRIGRVLEVVPTRTGVSGRVLAATVEGTSGELKLKGLQVRWGLGLRENLFAIDRVVGPDARIERFVFTGKGWGHGVGMCQVGAYGLAKGGATFEQILHHYYTGITIERIDDQVGHRDAETQR